MANVVFIKPQLETDATWEMVRTSSYLGIWFMASYLKERGHNVFYLDETERDNGIKRTSLYSTVLDIATGEYTVDPLEENIQLYREAKNIDFNKLSPKDFVKKYSAFRKDGKICRIIARTGNSIESTKAKLHKIEPDFICISLIATANVRASMRLGEALKKEFPKSRLIYGGQHVSACADNLAKTYPWIDHLVTGDGIHLINDIIDGVQKDKVLEGGFQPMTKFPLLDFDIIKSTNYPIDQQYSYPSFGRKSVDFMFSKGCFRKCDFCVAGGQEGNRVSMWNWDLIEEQFRIFKSEGIEELIVQDDAFIQNMKDLNKKLCLMKKYGFYWQNSGGIDFELLDDSVTEMFINYNQNGEGRLTGMYVPFNPRDWNRGNSATGTMVNRYVRNFENLKRLREEGRIYVFTSDIIGTPEQNFDTVCQDIRNHKEMITQGFLDAALTLSATMLPGTAWYRYNGHNIISKEDAAGFSLFTTHHKTDKLSPFDIEELVVLRTKELNDMQKTYNWQTAFPNSVWDYKDNGYISTKE